MDQERKQYSVEWHTWGGGGLLPGSDAHLSVNGEAVGWGLLFESLLHAAIGRRRTFAVHWGMGVVGALECREHGKGG